MKTLMFLLLLLTASTLAMDPPAIEWVRLHDDCTAIFDVEEANGGFICGCSDAIRFMSDQGYIQWTVSHTEVSWHYIKCQSILHVDGEGYVSTGVGKISPDSSYSIFLLKVDYDGNPVWIRNYDDPETTDYAFNVISLPDDGYAIAGRHGWDAWILRTDSQGDTLWTREWGWSASYDIAGDLLYHNNGILVYAHGNPPETPKGGYLLRYDMDGNLEWETFIEPMAGKGAQDMCEASDGGLLLMNDTYPLIVHTDYLGNADWWTTPQGWDQDYGWSINTTMDGGFVVGVKTFEMNEDNRSQNSTGVNCGVVSRHSVTGEIEWWDYVYEESCAAIHCIRQLSQGGYIAAGYAHGGQGFLMRYAPETGIEELESSSSLQLEVFPNPFSSVLSVSFNLPEAGTASISIHDLSGRLVDTVADEMFPAGESKVEWTVPACVSSGCYLIKLSTEKSTVIENCVLLR